MRKHSFIAEKLEVVSMSAFLGKGGRSGGTKNAQEQSFPCTRITSAVFPFSRFHRNDQNITEPFTSSHSRTMLLGDIRGHSQNYQWKEALHYIQQRKNFFHTNVKRSRIVTVPFGRKFSPVFPSCFVQLPINGITHVHRRISVAYRR